MGYTTNFSGQFLLDRKLAPEHKAYLKAFSRSRRMLRNAEVADTLPDPVRTAAGLPIGTNGEFYVGSADENMGQGRDESVTNYNNPPSTQPGLWCQWVPTEDGDGIEWDGGEKFSGYLEWIKYIIENFLKPWGYVLNGTVKWYGEDPEDLGQIIVKDNVVTKQTAEIYYR